MKKKKNITYEDFVRWGQRGGTKNKERHENLPIEVKKTISRNVSSWMKEYWDTHPEKRIEMSQRTKARHAAKKQTPLT